MNFGQQPNYYNPYFQQQQQYPTIHGKIVESEDIVRICEVPIGGYSVYPLADMSKVIIKNYDVTGNLQYLTYELAQSVGENKEDKIYAYLEKLEKKLDDLKPLPKKKIVEVEVDADE